MQMVSRVSPVSQSPSACPPTVPPVQCLDQKTFQLHASHQRALNSFKLSVPREYKLHVYQLFIKMTWDKIAVFFLQLSWTVQHVTAIHRHDIYPYGMFYGDAALQAGDDETSEVITLTKPMYFYEASFNNLYVATNGIISTQDLPMEKQYVDDGFPTDFPVIAPFLADIDTSKGKGSIFYRQTESPTVLKRAEADVKRGFPDTTFTPTHAFIATWENVSAYEEVTRSSRPSNRVNTFQVVLAYNERDTYALFLYPEDGLQFFGSRPKESYYVEIELPARVGFTRGELSFLFFSRTEGPYYSVTSDEQSVKNLYQKGNIGERGVWLFHIGNRYSFQNVVPAQHEAFFTKAPPVLDAVLPDEDYSETDEEEYDPIDPDFQDPTTTEFLEPEKDSSILERLNQEVHLGQSPPQPSESGPGEFPQPDPHSLPPEDVTQPQQPLPKHAILQVYPNRVKDVPPSGGQVFSVEEKVDFDSGVIHYSTDNKETCERFQQQCSQNAHCTDYSTGFCCHCNSGFYGNGQHCLPNGAPHRVNGKVRGTVLVGGTAVQLDSIDLHAYIVVGDGRAYTAISEVPEPVGWALMPVAPIGGLFGWLFALELPNSLNGFSITGAEFTRRADVIFYPGNQRLSIVQTATGLDTQNYLNVDTHLQGSVPFIPPGATVQMEPFKDTYHYYPSLITSTSVREFTVTSAENGAETHSFQVKQNITYRDCTHGPRSRLETLELRMERIFVMYVKEERILRYAITNKIGPLGAGDPEPEDVNPCYSGNHDCDTTAQCMPGEGQLFSCQCATGYRGDGRNCYDVDECAEGLSSCGAHSYCVNLPGSHRCQCESGFEFGFDGRTCQDVDECRDQPCHTQALCSNSLGSFHCQCQPGYHGDGFQCHFQNGRPKTHCEQHRDSLRSRDGDVPLIGAFIPQCDEEGQYRPQQCHGSTGHCWCVDSRGQERAGTRTPPGAPTINCDEPVRPERPKTHCEQHRDSLQSGNGGVRPIGAFIPQCDEEGQYRPQQCQGSTGHCWCVDSRGQERAGTRTPPGAPTINCDEPVHPERPKTHCEQHRDSLQSGNGGVRPIGAFIPQCDEEGQYRPQQCHGSTGHCWCVDSRGQERAGTKTPPGAPAINCDEPVRPKTHCEQHRDSLRSRDGDVPLIGAFIPQCDEEGQYRPQQCHGSTGHCWCVDSRGQERAGTRTPPGAPAINCDEPVPPVQRPETVCERWRASLMQQYGGQPDSHHYLPQCDSAGEFNPVQCYGDSSYCWCVDQNGREVPGTRSHDAVKPACIPTVAPPTMHPLPRPDVTPPPSGTSLLYAQGQQIGVLPLIGTQMDKQRSSVLLALHGSIVVGIDYDCRERKVYWTDLAGRTINRASLEPGSEPEIIINTALTSPEGLAIDVARRRLFWVDSTSDKIETANLDGSDRRVLFDTDLVNPRAIIVHSPTRTLYWTDWNREAPKIESSSVDGQNRRVLVQDGIGLPNALTHDSTTGQVCWADAGTKRLECISPNGTGRRVVHSNLNYPFSMVAFTNHYYYTDWRRDGVIALNRDNQSTDEHLPDQRSHLYGITVAPPHCL
uniref:Nidogen 2 n=1 Tax=Cyprinus carpio carpio TaxID=630221 RepID=A0A9J7ZVC5_CYPCA